MDFRGGLKLWRYPTDPSVIQNDNDDNHASDIDKSVSCAIYIYIISVNNNNNNINKLSEIFVFGKNRISYSIYVVVVYTCVQVSTNILY